MVDVFSMVAENLVRKNQENSITVLVKYIVNKNGESQKIIDEIMKATIKAKPQKPDIFLSYISDISTKVKIFLTI